MSIFITGGSGFIASHLINYLSSNYKVYSHFRSARKFFCNSHVIEATPVICDLSLENLLKSNIFDCNCIIHLAGSFSAKTFEELVFDNLITTNTILDFMRINKIPKIIFISSAAVWGKNLEGVATEKTPADPETDYAHTKFSSECLIQNAYLKGDIETAFILRPNTIYGYGSNSGVIDSLINQASTSLKFQIFDDGLQCRQPLHINDLIEAINKCLTFNNKAFNIYGVAGPESYSILNIANKISKIFNVNFECEFSPAQVNKPKTILIDQSKIKSELSWHPKITLDYGLKTILDLRNRLNFSS